MTTTTSYHVLLVEDEPILSQALAKHIGDLDVGFKVIAQAANGFDALQELNEKNIHLVITDIRMPVMDGLELAKKIHDVYPHVLTIVLTGYADFEYAQEAIKQEVFDYLLKPITQDDLLNALNHARLRLEKYCSLEESPSVVGRSAKDIVEYTVSYLREHFMNDIDFSTYSSEMGFSSAYLTKIFNRHTGSTPSKYLTDLRINEAKRLLLDTDLPIKEIGEQVGYPDQFHFSKTFRKLTGTNPTSFRKEAKEQ